MHESNIISPVILCGGSGTRLWPISRESMPKQFTLLLDTVSSTFQNTAQRASDAQVFLRPTVLTDSDTRFIVAEQLAAANINADIILEPEGRDSAAAIAVATLHVAKNHPQGLVLILASDHVIDDTAAFVAAVEAASRGAQAGYIMTLGVTPTGPSTAYGYIQPGSEIETARGAYDVERFLEKPNSAEAAKLIAEGALWNSGYFLYRADVMLAELEAHAPEIIKFARQALDEATTDLDFIRLDANTFSLVPKISIDYALMENTDNVGVFPVQFKWSDVGTWEALWEVLPHDGAGNSIRGRVETIDTYGSLIHSQGDHVTTVIGLEQIVVVTTPDAVLVVPKARSNQVKELVAALREKGHREANEHRRMYRPWGWYQQIDIGQRFQVKRIMVNPGGRLSLQKHFHRAEHWVVVKGTAEVTLNQDIILVHENEAVYLPIGSMHRLTNPGKIPLELIEVQVGSYTGEDDIIRLEDVYGRSS